MELITYEELNDLLLPQEGVHLSLFMPLEWEPNELQGNPIRLKNLMKQAEELLDRDDFFPPDMVVTAKEMLLQPVQEFLRNGRFLDKHGRGLAIFVREGMHRIYHLPLGLDEQLVIAPRFYIRPLLPVWNNNGRYYLLSLSQNKAQLWHGTQYNLEEIDLPALPQGMSEALALEDPEPALQFHTSTRGGGADRPAVFHGHEAEKEKKGAILRYCREVNKAVQEQLAGEELPLILAAVSYLWPIYQEANTYPHLLLDGMSGNPDHLSDHELHQKVWPIIQQSLEKIKSDALHQYQELGGTQNISQSLTEIVPAAAYGRVDTLFVATGGQKLGRFEAETAELETCQADAFDCEDLLNLAAAATLSQGGTVYAVQPEQMPGKAPLGAIFRYTV